MKGALRYWPVVVGALIPILYALFAPSPAHAVEYVPDVRLDTSQVWDADTSRLAILLIPANDAVGYALAVN